MTKRRLHRNSRDSQLMAMAGLIAAFLFASQLNLEEVLRIDRWQHFAVSGGLFFLFYFIFLESRARVIYALSAAFSIGVAKEIFDHQGQIFDIYANSVGLVLAMILLVIFQAFASGQWAPRR